MPGHAVEHGQVGVLAEGQDQTVGLQFFELAGRLREPGLV